MRNLKLFIQPIGDNPDKLQMKQQGIHYVTRVGGVFAHHWDCSDDGYYKRVDSTLRVLVRGSDVEIVDEFSEEYEKGWYYGSVENPEESEEYEWSRSLG